MATAAPKSEAAHLRLPSDAGSKRGSSSKADAGDKSSGDKLATPDSKSPAAPKSEEKGKSVLAKEERGFALLPLFYIESGQITAMVTWGTNLLVGTSLGSVLRYSLLSGSDSESKDWASVIFRT